MPLGDETAAQNSAFERNETEPDHSPVSILYISYDGVLEPLGRSQVLQYLERLAPAYRIVLISFEKRSDWKNRALRDKTRKLMTASGISWIPLRYHKTPSLIATSWDVLHGFFTATRVVRRQNIQIVHARSYVSAVIALALRRVFGVHFVFDMRGFWPDEKVEGGSWEADSFVYRAAKWFERRFLLDADVVVSLTHAGVNVMRELPYLSETQPQFAVITTCTNCELFKPEGRSVPRPERSLVIGIVGSVGLWYMLDEMIAAFNEVRRVRTDATLLILNRDAHSSLRERLAGAKVPESAYILKSAEYDEVPSEMRRMDVGIFFIRPVYSKIGSAPTKLGEFLASGVP